jgi:hypothetical protein
LPALGGEAHPLDQLLAVGVHVVLACCRDRRVTHEQTGQLEVAGGPAELVARGVAEPVHRRGLHGAVAVLAEDAAQARVRGGVADPHRVEQELVRLRLGLKRKHRQLGEQVLVDDRDVVDRSALAAHANLAPLEVDIAPAQQPYLVLAQSQPRQQAEHNTVTESGCAAMIAFTFAIEWACRSTPRRRGRSILPIGLETIPSKRAAQPKKEAKIASTFLRVPGAAAPQWVATNSSTRSAPRAPSKSASSRWACSAVNRASTDS